MPRYHASKIGSGVVITTPNSLGSSGQFLQSNGSGGSSWASLSPGGSDTQVQFNDAGAFGGSADLTFDGNTLAVSGVSTGAPIVQVTLPASHADNAFEVLDSVGANKFRVDNAGTVRLGNSIYFTAPDPTWTWKIGSNYGDHIGCGGNTGVIAYSQLVAQNGVRFIGNGVFNYGPKITHASAEGGLNAYGGTHLYLTGTTGYGTNPNISGNIYLSVQPGGAAGVGSGNNGGAAGNVIVTVGEGGAGDGAGTNGADGTFLVQQTAAAAELLSVNYSGTTALSGQDTAAPVLQVNMPASHADNAFEVLDSVGATLAKVDATGAAYFAGSVGVGTASPANELEVYSLSTADNYLLSLSGQSNRAGIVFRNNWGGGYNSPVAAIKTVWQGPTNWGTALTFSTRNDVGYGDADPTEHMRITKSGNVGIGTTTLGARLTVNGNDTTCPVVQVNMPASHADNAFEVLDSVGVEKLGFSDLSGTSKLTLWNAVDRSLSISQTSGASTISTQNTSLYLSPGGGGSISANANILLSATNPKIWQDPNWGSGTITIGNNRLARVSDMSAPQILDLTAGSCYASATTYIEGGGINILSGHGASGSAGDAHGGAITLQTGIGYGTGHDGHILLKTGSTDVATVTDGGLYLEATKKLGLDTLNTDGSPKVWIEALSSGWYMDFYNGYSPTTPQMRLCNSQLQLMAAAAGLRLTNNSRISDQTGNLTFAAATDNNTGDLTIYGTSQNVSIGAATDTARLSVNGSDTAAPVLQVNMPASHADNAFEVLDSVGTAMAYIDQNGYIAGNRVTIPTGYVTMWDGAGLARLEFNNRNGSVHNLTHSLSLYASPGTTYQQQLWLGSAAGAHNVAHCCVVAHGEKYDGTNTAGWIYVGNGARAGGAASLGTPADGHVSGTVGDGTDIIGGSLYLEAGAGTGAGVGGSLYFQTPQTGTTGTTVQTLSTVLEIGPDDTLALFGGSPVAQHSSTGETTGFTAGAGSAVLVDSTFTGNVGSTAYTFSDIVKALKNYGLLAS